MNISELELKEREREIEAIFVLLVVVVGVVSKYVGSVLFLFFILHI